MEEVIHSVRDRRLEQGNNGSLRKGLGPGSWREGGGAEEQKIFFFFLFVIIHSKNNTGIQLFFSPQNHFQKKKGIGTRSSWRKSEEIRCAGRNRKKKT